MNHAGLYSFISVPCGIYNERRDVILWRLISMREIHLTCRDARLVRPPQKVLPACLQSLTSSVSRTHAPCVPTGLTEFLDIVSTYWRVSSCMFFSHEWKLIYTNDLRSVVISRKVAKYRKISATKICPYVLLYNKLINS